MLFLDFGTIKKTKATLSYIWKRLNYTEKELLIRKFSNCFVIGLKEKDRLILQLVIERERNLFYAPY